jgi:hypothetical protein
VTAKDTADRASAEHGEEHAKTGGCSAYIAHMDIGCASSFCDAVCEPIPSPPGSACPTSLQVLAEHGFMLSAGGIVALPLDGGGFGRGRNNVGGKLSPPGEG